MSKKIHICLIAGEASGENLACDLMDSLLANYSDISFSGIGGQHMQSKGLKSLFPMEELSLMGLFEVLPKIPSLLKRIHETVEHIKRTQPDILVTIDSPDFCFRVAKKLQESGNKLPKMVHYVAPTVWAWRPERAAKVAGLYDMILCLYPFEPPYFEKEGMKAPFIGHPITKKASNLLNQDVNKVRQELKIVDKYKTVGVFFGSRMGELNKVGPVFHEVLYEIAERMKKNKETLHIIAPTLPHLESQVRNLLMGVSAKKTILTDPNKKWDSFLVMDAAIATSGTIGLELSVSKVPHLIGYKMNPLTWVYLKRKITTRFAHLANILMDNDLVPEFIQGNCKSKHITPVLEQLIYSEPVIEKQKQGFEKVLKNLSPANGQDSSDIAAKSILKLITSGSLKERRA
jgi:lipid-A-disaccharide synthase